MSKPSPDRHRRRPGRRPPDRHRGGLQPRPPGGFTEPGLDHLYRIGLPSLAGLEKRAFFNTMARGLVVVYALGGALLGFSWLGFFGALLGLGGGLLVGARVAVQGRFFRG